MPEHILSLSYGKDSMACFGACELLGWPIDRVVTAEVWATDTIPADLPPMVEFKAHADEIIKQRWGIEVEHLSAQRSGSKVTFESTFYRVRTNRSNRAGQIWGWPWQRGAWCNSELKMSALKEIEKSGNVIYIGISADELSRLHNMTETKQLPLVKAGWTEEMCREWCEENDLLSPIYTTVTRGGCWFCHNQPAAELRQTRKNYPELWALMLKWDRDSPVAFKADGHTVHDYDRRFALEDAGLLSPDDKVFRWSMLDDELNYRMEEFT